MNRSILFEPTGQPSLLSLDSGPDFQSILGALQMLQGQGIPDHAQIQFSGSRGGHFGPNPVIFILGPVQAI